MQWLGLFWFVVGIVNFSEASRYHRETKDFYSGLSVMCGVVSIINMYRFVFVL